MALSFSSFLPDNFVTAMRDISWSVLGDEDLLLFLVVLALPGVLIIAAVALRVRQNYGRVRYAEGVPRRAHEYHSSSDSSQESSSGEDERDFMSLEEMLAATCGLAARGSAQKRAITIDANAETVPPSDAVAHSASGDGDGAPAGAVSQAKKKS